MHAKMAATAAALAIFLASAPVAMAKKNDDRKQARKDAKAAEKFSKHDSKHDRKDNGSVTRSEWKGSAASFDRLDTNRDGFLTHSEIRNGRDGVNRPRNSRFRGMDSNNDGRISRSEWRGNDNSFNVHDSNRDGYLSGDEIRSGKGRDRD